jgi:hypothetical protein
MRARKIKKELRIGLTIVIAAAIFVACVPPASALPTADNLGVVDNSGNQGTYVVAPVTITNAQDGPIISIIFDAYYNNNVIEVVGVQKGNLTSLWDTPAINTFAGGMRVAIVYDGQLAHALQNGSTGSIVILNLSVIGEPGETSMMNLTNIQLSDTAYNVGTAPAKNGTISIPGSESTPTPTPSQTEPPAGGGGGGGIIILDEVVYPTPTPTPTSMSTITPSVTPPVSPPVTLSPTPISSPSPTPALRQPSFEALVAIACLVAVAYMLRRRNGVP